MTMTNRPQRTNHGESGFTLVEMLVALLVMGILMTIAIPSIMTHIQRAELRSSAREVVETLRNVRDMAMNEGVPRQVLFDPVTQTYAPYKLVQTAPGSYDWQRERAPAKLDKGIRFTSEGVTFPAVSNAPGLNGVNITADAAFFGTRGRYPPGAPAGPYTITLTNGGSRTVVVTLYERTGQVTGV